MTTAPAAPPRIATLDGLRGFAVMGIALMNVVAFALPEGAYFNPLAGGGTGAADMAAWGIAFVLIDGKMRALFSLLFGASMLLVADGAMRAGGDAASVHYRRMATLFLFGIVHLYAIWWGDILTHYAIVGSIAFLFRHKPPERLAGIALTCFLVQIVMAAMMVMSLHQVQTAALARHATPEAVTAWAEVLGAIGIAPPGVLVEQVALFRGPWSGIARHLFVERGFDPLWLLLMGGAETLGLMLLGMAALRSGFVTGGWSRAAYGRVVRWGYGIGVTGTVALLVLCVWRGFDSLTVFGASMLGGTPFRPLVMTAHAALAILWLTKGDMGTGLRARIAAAGRAAFTNYLGTSLVFGFLFYGWGLGLFARVERVWLYAIVAGLWAVMLLWSRWWLARFRYGPLEWAWRSMARGRWQAMRV